MLNVQKWFPWNWHRYPAIVKTASVIVMVDDSMVVVNSFELRRTSEPSIFRVIITRRRCVYWFFCSVLHWPAWEVAPCQGRPTRGSVLIANKSYHDTNLWSKSRELQAIVTSIQLECGILPVGSNLDQWGGDGPLTPGELHFTEIISEDYFLCPVGRHWVNLFESRGMVCLTRQMIVCPPHHKAAWEAINRIKS